MTVLITYDVSTTTRAGEARLRRIAKCCENFGQRVQFSVFECQLNKAIWARLRGRLLTILDPEQDSLRFYFLGEDDVKAVEHHGTKKPRSFKDPLIV